MNVIDVLIGPLLNAFVSNMSTTIAYWLIVYFESFLFFILEILAGQLFFVPDKKKVRNGMWLNILIYVIVGIVTSVSCLLFVVFFGWNFYLNITIYFIMFAGCLFGGYMVFDYSFKNMSLITISSFALQHIIYQIHHLSMDTYASNALYGHFGYPGGLYANFMVFTAMTIVLYIIAYFLLSRKFKLSFQENIKANTILLISLITLIVTILMNSFSLYFNWGNRYMIIITGLFCILTSSLVLYIIFSSFTISKAQKESLIMERYYEEKLNQYQMERSNIELINIKCHDLRKQIAALEGREGPIDRDEIKRIKKAITIYDSSIRTGNDVIDTIIEHETLVCDAKHISLTCLIDGKLFDFMAIGDIYALFSNIIDNAIEAVEKLDDQERKFISLTASDQQGFIVFEETNYLVGDISYNDDGSLSTTKDNSDLSHGLGTKSIIQVCDKYDGRHRFLVEDERFTIQIIIPLNR